MKVVLNGETVEVDNKITLAQLLAANVSDCISFAVARNRTFIPRSEYVKTGLVEGDEIEIVEPMQGG